MTKTTVGCLALLLFVSAAEAQPVHKILSTTRKTYEDLAKRPPLRKALDNVPKLQGQCKKLKLADPSAEAKKCVTAFKQSCPKLMSRGEATWKKIPEMRGRLLAFKIATLELMGCLTKSTLGDVDSDLKDVASKVPLIAQYKGAGQRKAWYDIEEPLYTALGWIAKQSWPAPHKAELDKWSRIVRKHAEKSHEKIFDPAADIDLNKVMKEDMAKALGKLWQLLSTPPSAPAAGKSAPGAPGAAPPTAGAAAAPTAVTPGAAAPPSTSPDGVDLTMVWVVLGVVLVLLLGGCGFLFFKLSQKADQESHSDLVRAKDKLMSRLDTVEAAQRVTSSRPTGEVAAVAAEEPDGEEVQAQQLLLEELSDRLKAVSSKAAANEQAFADMTAKLGDLERKFGEQSKVRARLEAKQIDLDNQLHDATAKVLAELDQRTGGDLSGEATARLQASAAGQQIMAALRLHDAFADHPEAAAQLRTGAARLRPLWDYLVSRDQLRMLDSGEGPAGATEGGVAGLVHALLELQNSWSLRMASQDLASKAAELTRFSFDSTGVRKLAQAVFAACRQLELEVSEQMLEDLDTVARAADMRLLMPEVGDRVSQKECEIEPRGGTGQKPGTILEVLQPGFKDDQGRVLEAARAVVAS